MELFSDPEFWKALSAFAWPIAVLIIAWRFKDMIQKLLGRETVPVLVLASRRALEHRDMLLRAGATDVTTSTADVLKFVGSSCSGNRHNG